MHIDRHLVGWALLLTTAGLTIFRAIRSGRQKQKKLQLRILWRKKIEQIADDTKTDGECPSFDDWMSDMDEPDWEDLYCELQKMPAGNRSVRKAIEICNRMDVRTI